MKLTWLLGVAVSALIAAGADAQCPAPEKLLAEGGAAGDRFGTVDISGDRVIVGAYVSDSAGNNSGAAYIYVLENGTWTQETELIGSLQSSSDYYGWDVAIDGNRAVVGAPQDTDGTGSGYVTVFNREGGTWQEETILTASDVTSVVDAGYGRVAIDGDCIAVGSYKRNRAFVYRLDGESWIEEANLQPADIPSNFSFGHAIAIQGDVLVVGSRYDNELGSLAGAAYIYRRTDSEWALEEKLLASDGTAGDVFGYGVDVNGSSVFVGAPAADSNGPSAGAVYVFTYTSDSWDESMKFFGSDTSAGDNFGVRLRVADTRLLVGAHKADPFGMVDAGAAYLFEGADDQWNEIAKLTAPDGSNADWFGNDVGLDSHLVLSAIQDDDLGANSGSAYVFPSPITAEFNASPTVGTAPLAVQFMDLSVGLVTSRSWDFGDGTSSSERDPTHIYDEPGTYSIALTVEGPCGMSGVTRIDLVEVQPPSHSRLFLGAPRDAGTRSP